MAKVKDNTQAPSWSNLHGEEVSSLRLAEEVSYRAEQRLRQSTLFSKRPNIGSRFSWKKRLRRMTRLKILPRVAVSRGRAGTGGVRFGAQGLHAAQRRGRDTSDGGHKHLLYLISATIEFGRISIFFFTNNMGGDDSMFLPSRYRHTKLR